MGRLLISYQAGREVARAGITSAEALTGYPGGWNVTYGERGPVVHSDRIWVRWHDVLDALARR